MNVHGLFHAGAPVPESIEHTVLLLLNMDGQVQDVVRVRIPLSSNQKDPLSSLGCIGDSLTSYAHPCLYVCLCCAITLE